ncbi:hypothetical protein EMIHUDRAFT_210455 [Emiliania huxleyi CCMP1516]|uniref:NUC153 domain-containing protein n=2 Tax=Emiliania huxleyi TaxID=2903 RepID=A0A0D3J022_EMIH1|nr:hypothetical protein EMIHUDRAFT_210455 [Emiliania huxleyi CCMP1516]EOD16857.1 hypothetical protein EMIHUDRAFT_210455 [Emiliania huxleyi CCMP1516]|eukprot:XP_005769286.1 hypothetical protein EMIHUDRAFT_210455 [Emiliania huxleyi CCMP1516]
MRLTKTELNSVPIYNLSSVGKALPLWVHDKKSRAGKARAKLRPADAAGEHVEVIQDLFFPTMCGKAKLSSDGETLLTTGGYPPQLRAFELRELSLKFERHFNAEVVDFQVLSADWKKAVYLLADRSVEFHTQFGKHHTTRIPVHGRCLGYQPETTELLLAGAGPEVYRLSLERGAFLQPLDSGAAGVNAIGVDPTHGMVVLGTADGTVQCWDPRQRSLLGAASPFAAIDAVDGFGGGGPAPAGGLHLGSPERSVTSVRFDPGGLLLAAGTSSGHVALYDVRSSRPDHKYGLPVHSIKFHQGKCVSADAKIIKIWDHAGAVDASGEPPTFASIQPPADVNGLCAFPDSGLLFAPLEAERAYFIPALGPAPKWCHFVDSLTEEMEAAPAAAVYDDYKFVTAEELGSLGLSSLVGTKALRPYMHGFFVDSRLHAKAVSLSQPFAYEQWRKQRVQERLGAKTAGRIAPVKKERPPKVNAALAEEIATRERQAALFSDKDFEIDVTSEEYLARRPHARGQLAPAPAPPRNREPRMVGVQSDVLAGGASSMAPGGGAKGAAGAKGAGGGRGRGLPGAGGGERSERRGMLERHLTPQRGKGGKGGKGKGKGKGGISKRGGGRGGGRR